MEELQTFDDVVYRPAYITLATYNTLIGYANAVAKEVNSIIVTEDSIRDAKDTLARARKLVKGLNDERIAVKKAVLVQYTDFEKQVKEICSIIDKADDELNAKVRELEEAQRAEKKAKIREIWDKRVWQYRIAILINDAFDRWLRPQHLNKSMSLNQVEKDMVEWLEARETDLEALDTMDDEYTVEYMGSLDLTQAVSTVNARNERRQTVAETKTEETATFKVTGKANIRLVEMLLKENEITYVKG